MTAHAVTGMRLKWPDAQITWAVDPRAEPVLDRTELVDQVIRFDRGAWKRRRLDPTAWLEQLRLYLGLRRHRFDLGLDFQGHTKTALCLRLASPKRRLALRATDAFAARLNPLVRSGELPNHEVEKGFVLTEAVGVKERPKRPIMPSLAAERGVIAGLTADAKPLVTIQTGAGADFKRYPPEGWSAVAAALLEAGANVVVIGAPGDPNLEVKGARSAVGQWPLPMAMAAVASSAVHLSADTGSGHIAAAYGVPTVTVFGKGDPERFRPYSEVGTVLKHSDRPSDVSPGEIVQAARGYLEVSQRALFH